MKIINRIVECRSVSREIEATMTADEQVELMRLEDEVAQATDEEDAACYAHNTSYGYMYYHERSQQLQQAVLIKDRAIYNLNKYIERITKEVMACI